MIKTEIMENRLPPGFLSVESELAFQLDISRMPVSEAVICPSEEGLVEVRQRRGIRAQRSSVDDMRETYDLTILLEAEYAGGLTDAGLTGTDVVQLLQYTPDMD